MDNAKQHWKILQELGNDLENRVREFMVIGRYGKGVIVVTEDGQGFWFGTMEFDKESKTSNKPTLLDVPDLVQMAQGHQHILLLNKRGEIYSMGRNDWGQLGLGTKDGETYFSPQLISIIIPQHTKFLSVRCGGVHSVALTDDGKVWAWGSNDLPSPHQIRDLNPHLVVAVEAGNRFSLALTDQGKVYSWGWNAMGQIECGILHYISTKISTLSPVRSMAAGENHILLLTRTGEVWACGGNECGQLGDPTDTRPNAYLSKVAGLPPISQIASHPFTHLSIAMSYDQRCFVWGQMFFGQQCYIWGDMLDSTFIPTPQELPPFYSTVESPLSFFSTSRYTSHSITIPETLSLSPLSTRMSRMFDNPETSPDVQFVVEQRTIHAHRIILNNSSDYFARMFSEKCLAPKPKDPIVRVIIPDHSYQIFHAFLRFLYTDTLELHSDMLLEMFKLATQYLVPELYLSRLRTTLTSATCCHYYQLTLRHQIPELENFQQELVQFFSTNFFEVIDSDAYQSMDAELCKMLTIAMAEQSS